jgi:large subunit ribosomal protein L25
VDFVAVKKGEKVTVDVQIVVIGEAVSDTLTHIENQTVSVEAEATHIPESIEVSVDGAEAGTQILAGALELPKGSTLLSDPELLIINVTGAVDSGEAGDDAVAEDAAEDAPAEA